MKAITAWTVGPALALLIGASCQLDDHSDEWPTSSALSDAQKQAAADLRIDLSAAQLCRHEHGEAGFTWTAAGELVCLPRRGKPVTHLEASYGR